MKLWALLLYTQQSGWAEVCVWIQPSGTHVIICDLKHDSFRTWTKQINEDLLCLVQKNPLSLITGANYQSLITGAWHPVCSRVFTQFSRVNNREQTGCHSPLINYYSSMKNFTTLC